MYVTFFTNNPKQITWNEVLQNPYISFQDIPSLPKKRVTREIDKTKALNLWYKRKPSALYEIPKDTLNMVLPTEEHYTHFQIPKKSNPHKMRQIDAPDDMLKTVQEMYKIILEKQLQVLTHKAAHAYVNERSTVTALEVHQKNNSKWYLQIDLKDFFNSITGEWLKKMLEEVYPFPFLPDEFKESLIKISLLNGTLPQGSVLSPTLTNLVMVPIDHELTEKLHNHKKHHYVYTRYADDITISCKQKFNPKEILTIIEDVFLKWKVPFKINNEKTRFGSSAGRNYHLGLIVNKDNKISAGHEKNNKFKAMLFNFCTTGDMWSVHDIQKMLGIISYYKSFEKEYVERTIDKYNKKFNINIMFKAKSLIH